MRDVNQSARARSHHRRRTAASAPDGRAPAPPARRPPEPRRPSARPCACRRARRRVARPAKHARRTPTNRDPSSQQLAIARTRAAANQRRDAQHVPQRAVSPYHARTYKAGQSSRRLVAVFVIAALLFLAVLARVTLLQTVQAR